MSVLLISDVHLCAEDERKTSGFIRFLRQQVPQAEALYILGDLFDAWIGDDTQPFYQHVCQALRQLPVPCYFMPGNHDFLLGCRFITASRLTLLPEPHVLTLDHRRTLLLHGDSLCTDDTAYQRLRYWVRQPWLQRCFLLSPLLVRRKIAQCLHGKRDIRTQPPVSKRMDVNQCAVVTLLRQYEATRLIHGHTHNANIHRFNLEDPSPSTTGSPTLWAERIVLGNWRSDRGAYLQISANDCRLEYLTL